ncbi:MAG: hypothetical protein K9G76_01680 [Bacteroidales bacterium]|nr:hypothetical protein [Bacteroidales bacterium]MCF8403264.1 hypothetical protein [Bacteroidales bacterium]
MLIFFDERIPFPAQKKLEQFGQTIPFLSEGIVYEAISGHPDIFMCGINNQLIIAPNLPLKFVELLKQNKISYLMGEEPLGQKFPETAKYNIVATDKYLMHNFRYTDSCITDNEGDLDLIHLNQGYSRCNLLPLKDNNFITSDEGIYRILQNSKLNVLYVNPDGIILPGQKHGFFGGACGVLEDRVFIIGNLNNYKEGNNVRLFLEALNYDIIELYDGPLFDGGSIIFINDL